MKLKKGIFMSVLLLSIIMAGGKTTTYAAIYDEGEIDISALDTKLVTKNWRIRILNPNKSVFANVYVTMTGSYCLANGTRSITDFTSTVDGIYADKIVRVSQIPGSYDRKLNIWCKEETELIGSINFKFLSNGNMIISTPDYYGLTIVDLSHDYSCLKN